MLRWVLLAALVYLAYRMVWKPAQAAKEAAGVAAEAIASKLSTLRAGGNLPAPSQPASAFAGHAEPPSATPTPLAQSRTYAQALLSKISSQRLVTPPQATAANLAGTATTLATRLRTFGN